MLPKMEEALTRLLMGSVVHRLTIIYGLAQVDTYEMRLLLI